VIHHAGRERRLGPDHGQHDVLRHGEIGQRFVAQVRHVPQPAVGGGAGVAGRDVNALHARRLGELPGQSVFAAAAADNENLHLVFEDRGCVHLLHVVEIIECVDQLLHLLRVLTGEHCFGQRLHRHFGQLGFQSRTL
jgi:hypothetical protein